MSQHNTADNGTPLTHMKWGDEYVTGIPIIDDQHQRLFSIINDLVAAIEEGHGGQRLDGILEALADYTEYHFETEEWYFDVFKYDESEAHFKEHRLFVDQIRVLKEHYGSKGSAEKEMDAKALFLYLQQWLTQHILVNDKRFTTKLLDSGHGHG